MVAAMAEWLVMIVIVLETTSDTCVVNGVGDSTIDEMPIGTVATKLQTTDGPIIGIFPQYALYLKGKTVHSTNQLRWFGTDVDDKPHQFGGTQCVCSPEGHVLPLSIAIGFALFGV